MKILVVEDSKFLRVTTEKALSRAGHDVCTASDGEEALEMARAKMPDLILLDMMLPKMTGPDVLKMLKRDVVTGDIPVVVLSGLSGKNAPRLSADGAFAFLEKSQLDFEKGPDALVSAVAEIIKKLASQS